MKKTATINVRLSEQDKAKLDAEVRRLRMQTGDNVTITDLIKRYIDNLEPVTDSKKQK
ncbi:hypothetical protein [Xenorhabdus sp. Sc-CR9]|uniref:hypothetical protein n=1 Tax=Xenorhabdus sp. Sc-CR9 TaxID=2584468 RepID=UPI001F413475|nr:hypothetical protein [Xenorhabdus sp. Sc-CR9]